MSHNNHKTPERQSKATSSLLLIKIIAKLDKTQSNAQQNMEQTQNPTMGATIKTTSNQQKRTACLRKDSSLSNMDEDAGRGGGVNAFYCTKFSVVIKAQNAKVAWRPPNYCNVSSQRNSLIKLTHFDETEKNLFSYSLTSLLTRITLVNVNAPVVATTSWWLHFSAPVVA